MKYFIIIMVIAVLGVGGVLVFGKKNSQNNASFNTQNGSNVQTINGKQIVQIEAKGGYTPKKTIAKADMPTVLKVKTKGTIDCSTALNIKSLGYSGNLKPTGIEKIDIKPQLKGTVINGMCSMGMYSFEILFE